MESRRLACFVAAGFIGVTLITAATQSTAKGPIVVHGQRPVPEIQRRVSYADLNLAFNHDQQRLNRRISGTAKSLCYDLHGLHGDWSCANYAVRSTEGQVADAIERAQRKMAGLPVGPAVAISMVIGNH
ncbi:MAG: UrcA family protein [Sphingomicrobium sp.]